MYYWFSESDLIYKTQWDTRLQNIDQVGGST